MSACTHHQRRRRGDRLTGVDRLDVQNGIAADYAAGPADRLAREMDEKWGLDRLPDLVTPDLAERFGRQREKLERALAANPMDVEAVRLEAQRMANAYRALDRAAEEAGAPKADPDLWEFYGPDGKRCAVVKDAAAAVAAPPDVTVYTLDEIARVLALDAMRLVNSVKERWPGAEVTAARPRSTRVVKQLEDEIPFAKEDR